MALKRTPLTLVLCLACAALPGAEYEGRTAPVRQVEVSALVSSVMAEVKVKVGERVKAGQPLAELYKKLEEIRMHRAKAILEQKEYEARGARSLADEKVIPAAHALRSRIDLDLARLDHEEATEQVRLRTLVAPIDGQVVERDKDVGESVQAHHRVFRIADLSSLVVQCRVPLAALAHAPEGSRWTVRFPGLPGVGNLAGEVVFADPAVDDEGLGRVRLVVDNAEGRLRAGLRAVVDLGVEWKGDAKRAAAR